MEITSMSSRGQVVIPMNLREMMGLKDGEKFAVIGKDDTIILKKIQMPSFDKINKMLREGQEFAKTNGITPKELDDAIKKARKR